MWQFAVRQVVVVSETGEGGISTAVTDRLEELGIEWFLWGGENPFATAVAVARNRGYLDAGDAETLDEALRRLSAVR